VQHPFLFFDETYVHHVRRSLEIGESPPELIAGGVDWGSIADAARQAAQEPLVIPMDIRTTRDQSVAIRYDLETGRCTTPDGSRPPDYSNDMLSAGIARKLMCMAFGAALTNDDALVQATVRLLMTAIDRPCWTSPEDYDLNMSPYAHSSMRMARFMSCVGSVYDLLYDSLTAAERDCVRDRLVTRGLEPTYQDLGASDCLRWPNGYTVLLEGLGVAALAVHRETDVTVYVRRAVACAVEFLDLHSPDGGLLEGYGYGAVGLRPVVEFLVALERAGMTDADGDALAERISGHPVFPRFLDFIIAFATPDGVQAVGFGDCAPLASARSYGAYLKYMSAKGSGEAEWLFRCAIDRRLDEDIPSVPVRAPPARPAFRSVSFPAGGAAVLRDNGPESPMLALKCGPPSVEVLHSHYDHNHIVLWHRGRLLLWDPGYRRELYGFGTRGHNTLLVDGRGQDVVVEEGFAETLATDCQAARERDLLWGLAGGTLLACATTPVADLVWGAAAQAYNRSAHRLRHFDRYAVLVRPDVFVVHDRLCAQQPRIFSLLFHGPPGSTLTLSDDTARIEQDNVVLDMFTACPGTGSWREHQAPAEHEHAPYAEFVLPRSENTSATTVLVPRSEDAAGVAVSFLEHGVRGVVLERSGVTDLVLFGFDDPPCVQWAGFEIDLFGVQVVLVRFEPDAGPQTTVLLPDGGKMASPKILTSPLPAAPG